MHRTTYTLLYRNLKNRVEMFNMAAQNTPETHIIHSPSILPISQVSISLSVPHNGMESATFDHEELLEFSAGDCHESAR